MGKWIAVTYLLARFLSSAAYAETITWMVYDSDPLPEARPNDARKPLNYLIDHMPQFEHRLMPSSTARADNELTHNDGICKAGIRKTADLAEFVFYNKRAVPFPGFHLVIRKADRDRFTPFIDEAGQLDLSRLAKSETLIGGYIRSNHYIDAIQHFIDDPERRVRLEESIGGKQLLGALQGRRIDFTVVLPIQAALFAVTAAHVGEFSLLPIKGVPTYLETFIACSNGPLGKRAIDAIDGILGSETNWREFIAPMRPWLDPPDYERILTSGTQ